MQIMKFKDMNELIERANNNIYGLAASVFTSDIDKMNTIASSIRAGVVWYVHDTSRVVRLTQSYKKHSRSPYTVGTRFFFSPSVGDWVRRRCFGAAAGRRLKSQEASPQVTLKTWPKPENHA